MNPERLLSLAEFAALTDTTERLARRLVAERRIRYVKVGKYVRISESALADFIARHTVEPTPAVSAQRPVRPALRSVSGARRLGAG